MDILLDFGQLQCDGVQVLVAIKLGSKVGKLGEISDEVNLILCSTTMSCFEFKGNLVSNCNVSSTPRRALDRS